jgi:hypothetical protein
VIEEFSNILRALSTSTEYYSAPPSGPPEQYPSLSNNELERLQQTVYGTIFGGKSAYSYMKLVGEPAPVTINLPSPDELSNKSLWSIDGSNKTLDYTAFHMMLSRSALVEYQYSTVPLPQHHSITTRDCSGLCIVDGNIFTDKVYMFSQSTAELKKVENTSWIDIIRKATEPLIVSYDSNTLDKKPSMHAMGWCNKFMQTLELLSQYDVPVDKPGVVIRDGPIFPIYASNVDIQKSLEHVLSWNNKLLICCSKRISESTLFLEFLMNPDNAKMMEYYFPEQMISKSLLSKLPADYLLLRKILKPGQRTPFIEVFPHNQKSILNHNSDLIPICCYYMRKRHPNTIVRLEFPKKYLQSNNLEWAISCVAWQHEIGSKVPHVQEFADRQCQVSSEVEILRKITASKLAENMLETMEVYE